MYTANERRGIGTTHQASGEGKECEERSRQSRSFSGICKYDYACQNHCINLEKADGGQCNSRSPTAKSEVADTKPSGEDVAEGE
ncbi:unnamed protein product [Brassica napus]|uniref:(rape) hypothetical protein n=1 Tax=Brassica napus TaxID=3708 RepID=A0A816IE22_BRANA|nr:unnamed protein product [Brassica napus]